MKTTQRSSYPRLALLGAAALIAALTVAAALIFRAGDSPPSNTTGAPIGASGTKTQHELVPGADAEKVKAWLDIYKKGSAQFELGNEEAAKKYETQLEQGMASADPKTRLAMHLERLYSYEERGSDPKIHEWLVWMGAKMIEDGEDEEEIAWSLYRDLVSLRDHSGDELDEEIQARRDMELGIDRSPIYDPRDPTLSEKANRIREYFYERHGSVDYHQEDGRTPRAVIDILVEGMDDLTAAKYLYAGGRGSYFSEASDEEWIKNEKQYAAEYADRVLANDPSSRDALLIKIFTPSDVDEKIELSRRLLKHHPDDEDAVNFASSILYESYPEETVAAISRLLPEDDLHSNPSLHFDLGRAYERLDMLYEAADQYQIAFAIGSSGAARGLYERLEQGGRNIPSIWEERAAAAEAAQQPLPPAESPAPGFETPPDPRDMEQARPHDDSDAPRGVEPPPPPPDIEAEMSAAYADFAKAYQSAFEMEYALSAATPEGYMNALLGMARSFARAGDAKHAQDAYNAARKRYSPEEIQQAFRRFDEQDRLRREASNEQNEEDDDDEP